MEVSTIGLLCILIGISNLPSVFLESKSENSQLVFHNIPAKTPDPINIKKSKAHFELLPLIYMHGDLLNKLKVTNNGKTVNATLDQPSTKGSIVTGGPLGNDIYEFYELRYLWTDDTEGVAGTTIDGKGYPLEALAVFFNRKYGSFKNALKYRDGLVITDFLIKIGPVPNPFFIPYGAQLKRVQKAGSSVESILGIAVAWYVLIIPPTTFYYAYPGSYLDETTGKRYYCATVIVVPPLPLSFLSKKQFDETFGSFKNSKGKPLTNQEPSFPQDMEVVHSIGYVHLVNLNSD